ncbi:MAG: hypothetical protein ACOYOB_19180 [Myxococcota bacterium]
MAGKLQAIGDVAKMPYEMARDGALQLGGAVVRAPGRAAVNMLLGKPNGALGRSVVKMRDVSVSEAAAIRAGRQSGRVYGAIRNGKGDVTGYRAAVIRPGGLRGVVSDHPILAGAAAYGFLPGDRPLKDMVSSTFTMPAEPFLKVTRPLTSPQDFVSPRAMAALQQRTSFANPLDNPDPAVFRRSRWFNRGVPDAAEPTAAA